jgi:hypothetical protein
MPALPIFDKGFTQEEINFGLEKFVEGVQQLKADYDEATCPLLVESGKVDKIRVDVGRVYWKLVKHRPGTNNHTGVYCFVRKADGAILKAANWRAPALNRPRGFVTEPDHGLHCAGPYGVAYLR